MMDVRTLIEAAERGDALAFEFFYTRTHPLSQWWAVPFQVDGVTYPTAEHYMMAEKARIFGDAEALRQVLGTRDPAEAKRIGRSVRGYSDEIWVGRRVEVVVRGNLAKFRQGDEIRAYLLQTGDRILVEASPTDQVWGIGLDSVDRRVMDPRRWRGQNLLGFALMDVRDQLRGAS